MFKIMTFVDFLQYFETNLKLRKILNKLAQENKLNKNKSHFLRTDKFSQKLEKKNTI